ncbi:hypothetical protein MATR_24420 [Marivirga tractuosa]|uniref:Uncharacterized protein n=1 Tax=Marivirga tractuosa (strain ATCC 23168 / DSM 4126 / NBRC 15989 / NCIMB 1408 / VKM B-1430 / H-43) TaxID=643867 RepID=E4TQK9_MARTH|nr:hypothetical protein Ftrac_3735 [Marivirga tractuosa DSM 4126]BDD15617.1 hypothetical protein MATR_24420 [Marivirga tractuosa]
MIFNFLPKKRYNYIYLMMFAIGKHIIFWDLVDFKSEDKM